MRVPGSFWPLFDVKIERPEFDSEHFWFSICWCTKNGFDAFAYPDPLLPQMSFNLGSRIQIAIRIVNPDIQFGSWTWILDQNRKVDSTVPSESIQIDRDRVVSRVFRRYEAWSRSNRPNPHKMGGIDLRPNASCLRFTAGSVLLAPQPVVAMMTNQTITSGEL